MGLVSGFQHVACVTNDLDAKIAFYSEVFGAEVSMVRQAKGAEPFTRHALIDICEGVSLHPFEFPASDLTKWGTRMLDQGQLDHFAIRATDEAAFNELRDRLIARGASDGVITDFTALVSVHFVDPDGLHCEVCWVRPDVPMSEVREPEDFVARL